MCCDKLDMFVNGLESPFLLFSCLIHYNQFCIGFAFVINIFFNRLKNCSPWSYVFYHYHSMIMNYSIIIHYHSVSLDPGFFSAKSGPTFTKNPFNLLILSSMFFITLSFL